MELKPLTPPEKKAINLLKKAAEIWPNSLWLFAADSKLYVMRKNKLGQHAITEFCGMDERYVIDDIDIDADGGDW